jgi:hypothetical protein
MSTITKQMPVILEKEGSRVNPGYPTPAFLSGGARADSAGRKAAPESSEAPGLTEADVAELSKVLFANGWAGTDDPQCVTSAERRSDA